MTETKWIAATFVSSLFIVGCSGSSSAGKANGLTCPNGMVLEATSSVAATCNPCLQSNCSGQLSTLESACSSVISCQCNCAGAANCASGCGSSVVDTDPCGMAQTAIANCRAASCSSQCP